MKNRRHYKPAPTDATALESYYQKLSLQQGKLSSAPLLPQHLVLSPRSETKRSHTAENLRNYELPQHVVDTIAREERDESQSLMAVEREDVLKHPTIGADDPTVSPRRAQPQQHLLETCTAIVSSFDHQLALSDAEDIEEQEDGENKQTEVTTVKATDTGPNVTRHIIGASSVSQQQGTLVDTTNPNEFGQSTELPVQSVQVIRHKPRNETTKHSTQHQGAVKDDVMVTLSDIEEPVDEWQMSQTDHQTAEHKIDEVSDDLGVEDLDLEPAANEDLYREMEQSVRKEVGWKQGDTTNIDSTISWDTKPATKKKRPKGRIVPSRYMSSAQLYTGRRAVAQHKTAIAAKVKSLRSPKSDMQHEKQTELHSRSHISHKSAIHTPSASTRAVNKSIWESTPFLVNDQGGLRGKSSIPEPDISFIARVNDRLNASVRDRSHLSVGQSFMGQTRASQVNESRADAATKSRNERREREKGKSSVAPQFSQKELDLLKCRMHQWSYLATMADKALYEQEQEAMKQLYAVWSETEALRDRFHTLNVSLQEGQRNEALDRALDEQLKGLAPIVQMLNRLEPQFSRLAHALDTTRHQLPTKGIQLPDKPEKLEASMNRSEQVLGDVVLTVRQQQQQAASLSQTIQALENATQAENNELQKCQEYLSACESLQTQETSMKIHQMQTETNAEESDMQ